LKFLKFWGKKDFPPQKSSGEVTFSVLPQKEHVVFNNINSSDIGVVEITNKSASVMRVLIYDDFHNAPETVALAVNCGGVYCGHKIVIRAKETPLSGVTAFLHAA
jgi:hypothetical protein